MFTVHARKAWLKGLSPKENREIPPLDYPRVYQLKKDFPHLTLAINGGVKSLEEAEQHLAHLDGVMVGRQAYQSPFMLAEVDQRLFGKTTLALHVAKQSRRCSRTSNSSSLKGRNSTTLAAIC